MANKGGFECEFVEKPPKAFQTECPVCLQILREPFQITCCGYAFCQVCIERVKQDNEPCPCCKLNDFDKFEDKRLKRTLYKFKVRCISGCGWEGELGELDGHLNSNPEQQKQLEGCQLIRVKCLYCSESFQRQNLQVHQSEQCPQRPFSCEYCGNFNSNYEDVTTNHWPKCGHYPMDCPNKCGKSIECQNLETHISSDCPLTVVDCDFSHVGCEIKLPRKDMLAHLEGNVVKHVSLQAANYKMVVNRLEEENKQLKEQVAKLTQDLKLQQICTPICPAKFTMTNFEQHKTNDNQWISSPFYTHPKGYKFCMVVTANSYDECKGTHTSVGVYLMKGEFDDQLEWPFLGYITIRLLSQEDEEYYERKIPFTGTEPSYDNVARRVTTKGRERAETGCAIFKFISHVDLKPKYLKHDCLKLCAQQYTTLST